MKYITDDRRTRLLERIRNQARRLHMLKNRHIMILPAVGNAVAAAQASFDAALAAESERLLTRANNLARNWLANGNPNEELEREIEQLMAYLERRRYPRRRIVTEIKTPDPPVDGIVTVAAAPSNEPQQQIQPMQD